VWRKKKKDRRQETRGDGRTVEGL
jgi:hypothetical protein